MRAGLKQKELKNKLENIQLKGIVVTNPMFMITGILKGYSETEFVANVQAELKVIKNSCNPTKENWILQAQPLVAKWFLKRETVNFDMMKGYVQDYLNLGECLKCCGFGHVAKYCKESLCCHKSGAKDHSIFHSIVNHYN